jgi:hypothetical protein
MRLWWFSAHAPSAGETGNAAARAAGETQYRQFKQGHRFIDDLPVETLGGEDDVKSVWGAMARDAWSSARLARVVVGPHTV